MLVVRCKVMLSVVVRDEGILFCQREGTPSLCSWPDALSRVRGKMTLVLEVERLTVGRDSREREDDGEMEECRCGCYGLGKEAGNEGCVLMIGLWEKEGK